MPKGLDSADRKLLIGAGVLLVAAVIASTVLSPPKEGGGNAGFPSSYSSAWDGGKAAYYLLQESGYKIERWENQPSEITGEAGHEVLILADPALAATPEDIQALREFVQQGGRILATGPSAARLLPEGASFVPGEELDEKTKFKAQLPSPLTAGAPEISMSAPKSWKPQKPGQLVIYGNEDTAAVVNYHVGSGQIVWWGSSSPLTNGGIEDSGNLALLLNSIGPRAGTRVLWDEYFHGAHRSIWEYFGRTPVLWGMAQVALVFVAIVLTHSRRSGPMRMPAKKSRLSPLEFVETLGDLYAAGHAGTAAVRVAYQRLRFLLTRQLGLVTDVPAAAMARSASEALGWKLAPISDTLSRADRATREPKLSDEDSLKLVQELFDYTARLEMRGPRTEERHTG
jgi:Domain of unknown function (DUF4350)